MATVSSPFTEDTYEFGKEAADAFIHWRFKPSLYNEEVVPVRLLIEAEFNLVY